MPQRQGKCINFGLCSMADSREAITLPEGEDFSCPECGKMLAELEGKRGGTGAGGSKGSGKGKLALAGVALVLLAAGGYFLMQPKEDPKPVVPCAGPGPGCMAPAPAPEPVVTPPAPEPVVTPPAPQPIVTPPPQEQKPDTPAVTPPQPKPVIEPPAAEVKPSVTPPPHKPPRVVTPKVKEEAAVQEPPAPVGPSSGTIVWEGNVHGTEFVTIENGAANKGVLLSGKLPGVPVLIQPQNPKKVGIAGAPGPDSKYQRVTLRVQGNGAMKVVLNWSLP